MFTAQGPHAIVMGSCAICTGPSSYYIIRLNRNESKNYDRAAASLLRELLLAIVENSCPAESKDSWYSL